MDGARPQGGTAPPIGHLLREATARWLKGHEVLYILRNYRAQGYSHNTDVVRCPPSGSVFLFRPKVTKYRLDGVDWRRSGRDGKRRLQEGHEKLKVDGVEVLRCCYVQAEDNRCFHRRVYSLLDASDPTVLVHYLQDSPDPVCHTAVMPSSTIMGAATSASMDVSVNAGAGQGSARLAVAPLLRPWPVPSISSVTAAAVASPYYGAPDAMMLMPLPAAPHAQQQQQAPMMVTTTTHCAGDDAVSDAGWDLDEELMALVSSPSSNPPLPGSPSPVDFYGRHPYSLDVSPQYQGKPTIATIHELSPEWDYVMGGAKVLVTGHFPPTSPGIRFTCMFDNVVVPADAVQPGVLRCFVPSHAAGIVSLSITLGDRTPVSNVVHFEYRDLHPATTTTIESAPSSAPSATLSAFPASTQTTPSYDDSFKADVLKRLAALESTMRHVPATAMETEGETRGGAEHQGNVAEKSREQAAAGDNEYQKLWEAFSILVKLEGARSGEGGSGGHGSAPGIGPNEREEQAALLIQSTFRDYRRKKRNEAAKKIQKVYRQRYAKLNGAATTIQAAFRGYAQKKMRLNRMELIRASSVQKLKQPRRRPGDSRGSNADGADDDDDGRDDGQSIEKEEEVEKDEDETQRHNDGEKDEEEAWPSP